MTIPQELQDLLDEAEEQFHWDEENKVYWFTSRNTSQSDEIGAADLQTAYQDAIEHMKLSIALQKEMDEEQAWKKEFEE